MPPASAAYASLAIELPTSSDQLWLSAVPGFPLGLALVTHLATRPGGALFDNRRWANLNSCYRSAMCHYLAPFGNGLPHLPSLAKVDYYFLVSREIPPRLPHWTDQGQS